MLVVEWVVGVYWVVVLVMLIVLMVLVIIGCLIVGVLVVLVFVDVGVIECWYMFIDFGVQVWLGLLFDDLVGLLYILVCMYVWFWYCYLEFLFGVIVMVVYMFGIIGLFKGVQLSWWVIVVDFDVLVEVWQWMVEDVLVYGLLLYYVYGLVLGLFGLLWFGNCFVYIGKLMLVGYVQVCYEVYGMLFFGVLMVWL